MDVSLMGGVIRFAEAFVAFMGYDSVFLRRE
jgi:hypothetical protein